MSEIGIDLQTITKAVGRTAMKKWRSGKPEHLFKSIMQHRMPAPVPSDDREAAVNVHYLRACYWGLVESFLHRIGRRPSPACAQCSNRNCPTALLLVCREEADTPEHVLLRCPHLGGTHLYLLGTIRPSPDSLKDANVVTVFYATKSLSSGLWYRTTIT